MGKTHLVVDGSNIATEGRTAPSLAQLDEAVREFLEERSYEQTIVVVDATFGHRIDASERDAFEDAAQANELITPPAGTIGRGDAFILEVARRAGADVLSNDSFQELHAEHPWLFEPGRLWGGKPVPAVGWVFVARAPVRGVTSRKAVQAAKKAAKKASAAAAARPAPAPKPATKAASKPPKERARPAKEAKPKHDQAKADQPSRRRSGRERAGTERTGRERARPQVNEQLAYAAFVVNHPIGSLVSGTVDRFSSHGAYVRMGSALGYVPLKALGDPPPRSAREVLTIGEERAFTVVRFDPSTRGIDVVPDGAAATTSATPTRAGQAATAHAAAGSTTPDAEEAPVSPVAKRAAKKKAPAKKKAAAKKTTARKTTAKKSTARKSTARKSTARKSAARKSTARKSTAKKSTARKSAAKKAPAKRTAARKSAAKRSTAKKKSTARKATARKR